MMSRRFLIAVSACAIAPLWGCGSGTPAVEQYGAMREVMRDGHTEARVRPADAVARPHAVGVGALEGLAGEVTIVDGDVWVARVEDGDVRVTGPAPADGDRATLLTLAHVARWQSVTIDRDAEGGDVEAIIERAAGERGIDTSDPFPFIIEGAAEGVDLHVINGYCPIATDPATIDAEPWRLSISTPTDMLVVGFFAPDAAGVMTHHGTSIHAHAVLSLDGETITGHVDRVDVAPGMTLRLPRAN